MPNYIFIVNIILINIKIYIIIYIFIIKGSLVFSKFFSELNMYGASTNSSNYQTNYQMNGTVLF